MSAMKPHEWQSLIRKAAADHDTALIESLADHLAACELANAILRAKGYGESGMSIDATARLVPDAH